MKRSVIGFLNFLASRHLLDAYFSQVAKACSSRSSCNSFLLSIFRGDPFFYLLNAFSWKDSPQGPEFWDGLDKQWQSYLREIL